MASDFGWAANGVPFETAFGPLFLTDATLWRPPVEIRDTPIEIPGAHGALRPGLPVYGEPRLPLVLRSRQASQAALEEAVNQAISILTTPGLVLSRTSGALVTSAAVSLRSITTDDFTYAKAARITALFAVPGVFFRGASWTSDSIAAAGDLTNQELSGLSGSTAPIGDAVFRCAGPWLNPYISDPSTGTGLLFPGMVPAGQYLFMSAKPLSARLSTSADAWLTGGTDVSAALSFPAAGRLQLWPVVQTGTTRKVLVNTGGSSRVAGQTTLMVQGKAAYL